MHICKNNQRFSGIITILRYVFILFIPYNIYTTAFSQSSEGEILDTIDIKGKKIILYTNKKWKFFDDHIKFNSYDSCFKFNWRIKEIHSYPNQPISQLIDKKINLYENNSEFCFPLDTFKYLRGFKGSHTGVDLKADFGDSIRVAFDGKVRFTGNIHNGYGNLVIIRHFNELETYYSHLSKICVAVDQTVNSGEVIGLIGQTGRATTNHLHFETRYFDKVFDPEKLISTKEKKLIADTLIISNELFGINSPKTNQTPMEKSFTDNNYHIVVKGDTLYKIANLYSTSIENLCEWNKIKKTSTLHIGQKILVSP
jgi:LysM repeat protein